MRRHHHDAVGEIDRFGDIMGDVDDRLARRPPHLGEQLLHVVAGERIERRERLVHQQHRRIVGERTRDRDALLHAAGQMMRKGLCEIFELDETKLFEARWPRARPSACPSFRGRRRHCRARCARETAGQNPGTRRRDSMPVPAPLRWPLIGAPPMRISPEVGARNPAMMLRSVDLPHPLGPTTQRNSDASMAKLTPRTPGTTRPGVS